MKIFSLGESLHQMYLQLSVRDEYKAVKFVDGLGTKEKMALSRFWKANGQDDLRQLFFKSANSERSQNGK